MSYATFEARLQSGGFVLLDGGTGSELEKRGASMHPEAWCGPATLEHADILEAVHRDYLAAGADVITANTYASSRLMLAAAGYGDRVAEINRAAVAAAQRAREASGRSDVLVAGSLSHMCPITADSDYPDPDRIPSADEMYGAFHELATLLREAGCDLIMLEMMYNPDRIPLAFEAALATGLPVWAGFAVRRGEQGEVLSFARDREIPLADILSPLTHSRVPVAGLMHSPADVIADATAELRQHHRGWLMAYPDSGFFRMPYWQFENVIEPQELVEFARSWIDDGVQVLGGCCGLSPAHIAALHEAFRGN